jgi:hypothetical protein
MVSLKVIAKALIVPIANCFTPTPRNQLSWRKAMVILGREWSTYDFNWLLKRCPCQGEWMIPEIPINDC